MDFGQSCSGTNMLLADMWGRLWEEVWGKHLFSFGRVKLEINI